MSRRLLLTILLLCCALTARAAGPGQIVYTEFNALVLMNSDGSGKTTLTSVDVTAGDPALSPDGTLVAFKGNRFSTNEAGIFLMKAEPMSASNPPVLVSTKGISTYRMGWHPGGRRIAFANNVGALPEIFVLKVIDEQGNITPESAQNTAVQVTLANSSNVYEGASFSPDGAFLVMTRNGSQLAMLRVTDAAGNITPESASNPLTFLTSTSSTLQVRTPTWSPDGQRLVFPQVELDSNFSNPKSSLATLIARNAAGDPAPESSATSRTAITTPTAGTFSTDSPTWSPDGSLIAFAAADGGGAIKVFSILASSAENAQTNPRVQLTTNLGRSPAFAQVVTAPLDASALPANAIAWWPFEDSIADVLGSHHGTPATSPLFVTGKVGRAISLDGLSKFLPVANTAELSLTGNLTIEAWVNPTTFSGGPRTIISKANSADAATSYSLAIETTGQLTFSAHALDDTTQSVTTPVSLVSGRFAHVAVTIRGTELKFFIDGVVVQTSQFSLARPVTNGALTIGAKTTPSGTTSFFSGLIDEPTLYDRALTSSEIAAIVAAGSSGKVRDDAAANFFTNTNTAAQRWSYGLLPAATTPDPTSFALLPQRVSDGHLRIWQPAGTTTPRVLLNASLVKDRQFPARRLSLEPGASGEFSVARWTAPADGHYAVAAEASLLDAQSGGAKLRVWHGTQELASKSLEFGDAPTAIGAEFDAVAGDHIDFIMDADNTLGADATSVFAGIVAMPPRVPLLVNPTLASVSFSAPTMAGKPWKFTAQQADTAEHSGRISLRVQYSSDPLNGASWQDLPGGTLTFTGGSTWTLTTKSVPAGSIAFRIATTVAGTGESFSAPTSIYNVATPAAQLELTGTAVAGSDATGATTHRGDTLLYSLRFRNSGALPASGVTVSSIVPDGTKLLAKTKGATLSRDGSRLRLNWKFDALQPAEPSEAKTVQFSVLVLEPTARQDHDLDPDINAIGSTISDNSFAISAAMPALQISGTPIMSQIVNPLRLTVQQAPGAVKAGGLVSLDLTVTNRASFIAKKAMIAIKTATGLVLQPAAGSLTFLDANGQPIANVADPITHHAPVLTGRKTNPSLETDATGGQVAFFGIGNLLPNGTQRVRATFRVQYDWPAASAPTITFQEATASMVSKAGRIIEATPTPCDIAVAAADGGAPQPQLQVSASLQGAGTLAGNASIASVTATPVAVPGVMPRRFANQITYRMAATNSGTAIANFITITAPIPPGTLVKTSSLRVLGAGNAVLAVKPKIVGSKLIATLPDLPAGETRTLEFVVTVKARTATGTQLVMPGAVLSSREFAQSFASGSLTAQVVAPDDL